MSKISNDSVFDKDFIIEINKRVSDLNQNFEKLLGTFQKIGSSAKVELDKLIPSKIEDLTRLDAIEKELLQSEKIKIQFLKEKKKLEQDEERLRQSRIKSVREEEKNKQELLKTQIVQTRATIQEQKELERLEKNRLKQIKSISRESDAYKQLARQRTLAQNSFKALATQFGEDSTQAKEALFVFNQLDESFTKINKTAKDGRPFVGRYEDGFSDLKIELEKAEKRFKSFIVTNGKWSKETRKARREVSKLRDQVSGVEKQAKNADRTVGKLAKSLGALATATVVLQVFDTLTDIFRSSDQGSATLEKTLSRLIITISVFISRVVEGFDYFSNRFSLFTTNIELGLLKFVDNYQKSINIITFGKIERDALNLSGRIEELKIKSRELSDTTLSLSGVFGGFTDEVNKKIDANDKAIDQNITNIRQNAILRRQASELSAEIENLTKIYDDDSQTLIDRNNSINEAISKQKELNDVNLRIANNELALARQKKLASTDSAQAEAELQDAIANRKAVETQGLTEINNLKREQNSIRRDLRDVNLDFFISDVESRIEINNDLLQSEKTTQAERNRLLTENRDLQVSAFQRTTQALNKELNDLGKASVDFEELLKKSNEDLTAFVVNTFGESASIRVLEVVTKLRTQTQQIAENEQLLAEATKNISQTKKDVIAQEEALQALRESAKLPLEEQKDVEEILFDLERKRFEQAKEILVAEIELLDDNSELKIQKQKELNDLLIAEEVRRLSKIEEAEKRSNTKKLQTQEDFAEIASNYDDALYQKRLDLIDKDIEARTREIERLQNLAQDQSSTAILSIAEEEKKLEELEQKKREAERRKQARELVNVFYGFLNAGQQAKINDPDAPNPLTYAVTNTAKSKLFADTLAQFNKGTDKVANDLNRDLYTGTDDYIVRVDGGEMIMNSKQRAYLESLGFNTRDGILQGLTAYKSLVNDIRPDTSNLVVNEKGNLEHRYIQESNAYQRQMLYHFENFHKKIPVSETKYNEFLHAFETYTHKGNSTHVSRKKVGRIGIY